ncbi:DNA repair protein RadC [Bacillus sp. TS-2]|nr:DNA repair protein RadC [Bacillus sp. TS-2]
MEKLVEIVRIKQEIKEAPEFLQNRKIKSPSDGMEIALEIAHHYIGEDDREIFLVLVLNTKNQVIAVHRAHVGAINASIVHPREVFKTAFLNNSSSIIVAHQHPSGDPNPSREDIQVTKRLVESGEILGVEVLDHLIVTPKKDVFISLKEQGYI